MHSVILVIGKDYEQELEPFNEELEVKPWFNESLHPDEQQRFIEWAMTKDPTVVARTFDNVYNEHGEEWHGSGYQWKENADGIWEVWSTYNPDGYWDWYSLGGRWSNNLINKSGGECNQIDKKNFKGYWQCAAIVHHGEWIEQDQYGSEEEFKAYVKQIINEMDDDEWITSVDIHC